MLTSPVSKQHSVSVVGSQWSVVQIYQPVQIVENVRVVRRL